MKRILVVLNGTSSEIRLLSVKLNETSSTSQKIAIDLRQDYLKFNPCLHSYLVVFPLVWRDILRTSALLRYHNCFESLKCLLDEWKHFLKDSTISCLLKPRGASFIPIC